MTKEIECMKIGQIISYHDDKGTKFYCKIEDYPHYWHRDDGPAIEYADETREYFINGIQIPTKEMEEWIEDNSIDLSTDEGKMVFKLRWL